MIERKIDIKIFLIFIGVFNCSFLIDRQEITTIMKVIENKKIYPFKEESIFRASLPLVSYIDAIPAKVSLLEYAVICVTSIAIIKDMKQAKAIIKILYFEEINNIPCIRIALQIESMKKDKLKAEKKVAKE